jgi:hypothetical protein
MASHNFDSDYERRETIGTSAAEIRASYIPTSESPTYTRYRRGHSPEAVHHAPRIFREAHSASDTRITDNQRQNPTFVERRRDNTPTTNVVREPLEHVFERAHRGRRSGDPPINVVREPLERVFGRAHHRLYDRDVRRQVTREVPIPEGHDITVDYFRSGQGMWDHDRLLQETQEEARQREAEIRQRMMAEELTSQDRVNVAQEELNTIRDRLHHIRRARDDRREEESGPSRHREKSRMREEPEEECCEKLLRFLREESELQHHRWRETRRWQEMLIRYLIESRTSLFPLQANGDATTEYGQRGSTKIYITENINVYVRPTSLGDSANEKPLTARSIQVGFMFLDRGAPTKSRRLHQYFSRPDDTARHDTWLIERMNSFYENHVSSKRWVPPLRRLALAKFVRVSALLFE